MYKRQIVNSVSYEDGHKLQWSKADLQDLKDRCNEQSRQQGLHVPEKWKTFYGEEREDTVAWNKETYRRLKQAEKGEVKSYVQEIALAIMDCKETATSRETFMEQMQAKGYGVDWQDKHKYITFSIEADNPAAAKARLSRIETDVLNNFKVLGAAARPMTGYERLNVLHGVFHPDAEPFSFSWDWLAPSGLSTKDFIAPSSFQSVSYTHLTLPTTSRV